MLIGIFLMYVNASGLGEWVRGSTDATTCVVEAR
jgi:hypothetical protein